jgi:hypothetical protein
MYLGLTLSLVGWAVVLEKSVGAPRLTKGGVAVPRVRVRPGCCRALERIAHQSGAG